MAINIRNWRRNNSEASIYMHDYRLWWVYTYIFEMKKFAIFGDTMYSESTAGADASVEVPKLHNIKLLASFYTHIDYNYHDDLILLHCTCNRRKLK